MRGFHHPSLRTLFIRGELLKASPVTQISKNLSAMLETQVQTLGWEDSLEKGMTTHSRFLALENPWTEDCGGLQSMGSQRGGHD